MNLIQLQHDTQMWREKSFPAEHRTAPLQALGVCEEAGELAHAVLKMEQGIRGEREDHLLEAEDAVGDICIYLMGLCEALGLSFESCIAGAWSQVQQRDWSQHKNDGTK